jgi:hypothetical protein
LFKISSSFKFYNFTSNWWPNFYFKQFVCWKINWSSLWFCSCYIGPAPLPFSLHWHLYLFQLLWGLAIWLLHLRQNQQKYKLLIQNLMEVWLLKLLHLLIVLHHQIISWISTSVSTVPKSNMKPYLKSYYLYSH